MEFQAYCPFCEKKVSAFTILDEPALKQALKDAAVVEVMHLHSGRDHRWNLNPDEKGKLRKQLG